jgi:hypothetical protein
MMPVKNEELAARWRTAIPWLTQASTYGELPLRGAQGMPKTRLSNADLKVMQGCGLIERVQPQDVRGHVNLFKTAEASKKRFRPIRHTMDVNEVYGKESLLEVTFPLKRDICNLVHAGTDFIAFDFAAWYDQFRLHEDVRNLFCFGDRTGTAFRLCTLPMGQRQAVGIAHTATECLLSFEKSTTAAAIIDNSIFVGSREACIKDATTFIGRSQHVGATLNEDVSHVERLVCQEGDWSGIHLNMRTKCVSLAQKAVDKTIASWHRRQQWTWRGFAAHVGLLFWAWGILDLPMAEFFPVLRFVSEKGRMLTEHPQWWDQPAVIWESVWPSPQRWTQLVMSNVPRRVSVDEEPTLIVATDASAYGWGYVALNTVSGQVYVHGEPWSYAMRRYHGSRLGETTFSEPQAIRASLCHLLKLGMPHRVRIATDSTVSVASYNRGFNTHSFHINECLKQCNRLFGGMFVMDFVHIEGATNPSDGVSRGKHASEVDRELAAEVLRRVLGGAQPSSPHYLPV